MKMVRVLVICLGLVGLLVCAGTPASAAQSFLGYTGLVWVPTADALNRGDYSLGAYFLNEHGGPDATVLAGSLGVADGFEVGLSLLDDDYDDETFINGKYRFMAETNKSPAIAVGVIDLTDQWDTTIYVVMSKSIAPGGRTRYGDVRAPRFHLGIGGGMFDGIFAGLSAQLGDRVMLMAEYDTEDVNFGANLAITSEFRVHGALIGGEDFLLGISFNKKM